MPGHLLVENATVAPMPAALSGANPALKMAMVIEGDRIVWVGPSLADAVIDAGGRLVTPALIDCHTHIVHGGHRAREFEMRTNVFELRDAQLAELRQRLVGGVLLQE